MLVRLRACTHMTHARRPGEDQVGGGGPSETSSHSDEREAEVKGGGKAASDVRQEAGDGESCMENLNADAGGVGAGVTDSSSGSVGAYWNDVVFS